MPKTGTLEQRIGDKKPLFSRAEALSEANRCLNCYDAPCIKACPTEINIPKFIHQIASDSKHGSARTILSANILGTSCSRVCPVEVLCVGACVFNHTKEPPIAIGRLQRYATETALAHESFETLLGESKKSTGKKVACIGAGPASLAVAALVRREGHDVTVFEARNFLGGLNSYGVAPYKLHFADSISEIDHILKLGIKVLAERVSSISHLVDEFDAVFLGIGIGADSILNIPGAEGQGVYGATDLIERIKTDPQFSLEGINTAHVIGGGNTAIDIARELCLLGVKHVHMVYRGAQTQMSAYKHELVLGKIDGVKILENATPTAIEHESGRVAAIHIKSERLPTHLVVFAVGQNRDVSVIEGVPGIEVNAKGQIVVGKDNQRTGHPKVWAGGDCTNGGKEVVNAVAEAKLAAQSIHNSLANGGSDA